MIIMRFYSMFVLLACSCAVLPTTAVAATRSVAPVRLGQATRDVALQAEGRLIGQLLDAQGRAVPATPITVKAAGKEVARTQTDKDGKFSVVGLQGGVHQVITGKQQSVCRLWAPQTAPPVAQRGLLLINNADVVRGQCGCGTPVCGSACGGGGGYRGGGGGIGNWIANHPVMSVGAVAAAVAIPLALDDDDTPPASP